MHRAPTQALGLGLGLLATVIPAPAAASGPPLRPRNSVLVTVTPPASYHRGQHFSITLLVTLKKHNRHAYLLSFIQHSPKRCWSDVNRELKRTLPTHGAYYHHVFGSSPFTTTTSFVAGAPGRRRVCSYLFAKRVRPGSKIRPIAAGSAGYAVAG